MRGPLLIVNPASGGGRAGRRRAELERAVRQRWAEITIRITTAPGDAEQFALEWCESGQGLPIIAAGGDGTVHEVLNGLARGGFASPLGIIPAGTGNDFVGNSGIGLDLSSRTSGEGSVVDLGRLRFTTPAGQATTRVFANAASIGMVPRANRIAHRIRGLVPGRLCYRMGGLAALLSGGALEYRVRSGTALLHQGPALSLTFANGATFGGGMRISPESRTDDGALDLVAIGALGVPRALLALARVERGRHVDLDGVRVTRLAGPATVEGPPGTLLVEADGQDFIAAGPIEVDALPGTLTLLR